MSETSTPSRSPKELKRSITTTLLFFYVLGDVLGSGVYVLIGAVAGEVGGAFWLSFALGVSVAAITGLAYAELATKYPQAAGAALYVQRAFGVKPLAFLVMVSFLAASFAAAGSLSVGFASYFGELWDAPPPLLVSLAFLLCLALVNYFGITESVVVTMLMTVVEVLGLAIVVGIGLWYVSDGGADWGSLLEFDTGAANPVFALLAGVALAFFAMTGFENVVNVAEETIKPQRAFPRALVGGMLAAGVIYVLVAIAAQLVVGADDLASSDVALLEVVRADVIPIPLTFLTVLFSVIACVAIANTTLVAVVTQPRVLYGMAKEDVVPRAFSRLHPARRSPWVGLVFSFTVVATLLVVGSVVVASGGGINLVEQLANVTVVFLLFIYCLVILAALKLGQRDETPETFHAPRWLLVPGLVANAGLLVYVVADDWTALVWCGGLLLVGVLLLVVQTVFGNRMTPTSEEVTGAGRAQEDA